MTNIEQKAQALVNEVRLERKGEVASIYDAKEALCRAIERHEAFRQEVSDIVSEVVYSTYISTPSRHKLERFIIAKPDPLVEAVNEAWGWRNPHQDVTENLRAALAKRGLEIREKGE